MPAVFSRSAHNSNTNLRLRCGVEMDTNHCAAICVFDFLILKAIWWHFKKKKKKKIQFANHL